MTPISSLDPSALNFLNGMAQIQQMAQNAEEQMTTGLKINAVSDAPDEIAALYQTRSELAQTQQIDSNMVRVKAETDTAESTLSSAVSLLDQVSTLASEGETGTATAATRQDIAGSLGGILQQLVSAANTTVEGRYIFAGDDDQQAPYSIDLTQTNPVSAYQGSATTRQIQGADGTTFAVAQTAQTIFDDPTGQNDIFTSINNLRLALLNNDQSAIDAAMPNIQSLGGYLNQQLAFYGNVQDNVASETNYGANYETELQTQLSNIQDADMSKAITQMQQAQTDQTAALTARAQLPKTSLFDYLG
jgi:flagellar hook-associated protein 3 FlgL